MIKLLQTKKRSREISRICSELSLKSIKVQEDNSTDAKSRFPSRIVAYSLNWVFKNVIRPEDKKVVCLIDSDMFFIADVSINSLLEGNHLGLIPQYRGQEICYLWTGFAVFNFEGLEHSERLNFSLGNVDGERCDVGGYTHHYLKEFQPKSLEYEFINLVDFRRNDAGFEVETYISGNIGFDLQLNRELSILNMDIQGDATQVGKILGASESLIRKNYQSAIGKAIEYCSDLDLNPRNIDLIHKKHESEVNFIVLHYKNASNPRDFQDKRYSEIKYRWCLAKLENTIENEAMS